MSAFLQIAERRRIRQVRENLALGAMASRGDPKVLKRTIRDLERKS